MEKEVFMIITEDKFKSLSSDFRSQCKYVEIRESNEYENNKKDEVYLQLYKRSKKAKKELQEYLFKKRNNML